MTSNGLGGASNPEVACTGGAGQVIVYARGLVSASAVFMAVLGLGALFGPEELLLAQAVEPVFNAKLMIQFAGASCLCIAVFNWTSRKAHVREPCVSPLVVSNFWLYFVAAMLLIKRAIIFTSITSAAVAAMFSIFALAFGLKVLRSLVSAPPTECGGK